MITERFDWHISGISPRQLSLLRAKVQFARLEFDTIEARRKARRSVWSNSLHSRSLRKAKTIEVSFFVVMLTSPVNFPFLLPLTS